jgi:hypothetical protein
MSKNIDKYKKDLDILIETGRSLELAMNFSCHKEQIKENFKDSVEDRKTLKYLEKLPSFNLKYQSWYTEAIYIIKILIPGRIDDFKKLYEIPKTRKEISYRNYVIEDYLKTLTITNALGQEIVGPYAAEPQFEQQLNILKSCKKRFESTLFDIETLIQSDMFDSELDSAKELNKKGFCRGAGAISGVVLEKHLSQVCKSHNIKITAKHPTISTFNEALKQQNIIDIPTWRKISHLGDLRNLCDHNTGKELKKEDIAELIDGVNKITKTLF